jgi:hypothetical protein
MKAFLRHRLGRTRDSKAIDECITIYVDWYNNGKLVFTTRYYPEERYSGKRDLSLYQRLVKALKLDFHPSHSSCAREMTYLPWFSRSQLRVKKIGLISE